eukprot:1867154-Amphidinium_carterae.1
MGPQQVAMVGQQDSPKQGEPASNCKCNATLTMTDLLLTARMRSFSLSAADAYADGDSGSP